MRRTILTAAILLLLCGCTAQTEPDETSVPAPEGYVTTQQAAQAVVDSQADSCWGAFSRARICTKARARQRDMPRGA